MCTVNLRNVFNNFAALQLQLTTWIIMFISTMETHLKKGLGWTKYSWVQGAQIRWGIEERMSSGSTD